MQPFHSSVSGRPAISAVIQLHLSRTSRVALGWDLAGRQARPQSGILGMTHPAELAKGCLGAFCQACEWHVWRLDIMHIPFNVSHGVAGTAPNGTPGMCFLMHVLFLMECGAFLQPQHVSIHHALEQRAEKKHERSGQIWQGERNLQHQRLCGDFPR